MTKEITVQDVVNFLNSKPGYAKEGARRLSERVFKSKVSIDTCKKALKEFRNRAPLGGTTFNIILKEEYFTSKNKGKKDVVEKKDLKVLVYDIETSYNIVSTWRVGNKVSLPHYSIIKERQIICVSWKWVGEEEVYSLDWGYKTQDDKFLVETFIGALNEADVIVAHNGDNFDLKWLRTRALKHGLEMLPYYNQVDTLQLARKYFYLNSNKLDYISKFLGFEGKIHTEPELWDKVILEKSLDALCEMIEYCEEDVRQLEKVYLRLSTWDKPKQHAGVLLSGDKLSSPISGSKKLELVKTTTTPAGTLKRIMRDQETKRLFEMTDSNYKKWLNEKK